MYLSHLWSNLLEISTFNILVYILSYFLYACVLLLLVNVANICLFAKT